MRAVIIGWLVLALLLAAASFITKPYLNRYTEADVIFAHEYAGEMLVRLGRLASEAENHAGSPSAAFFLDQADELARLKHAAVHFKGDVARDFVYAFACAEEWCRASARAIEHPDSEAPHRAREALARARAEFRSISSKDYRQPNQGGE